MTNSCAGDPVECCRVWRNNVTVASKSETAGAIIGTMATGIAAVWLTGDPRAFGLIIAFVGFVVGVALGRQEWRTTYPHRGGDAGSAGAANNDASKAA